MPRLQSRTDYLTFALEHSPAIRASYESWRASQEASAIDSALPAPRLVFAEFLTEVQTRTGPQQRKLGLSQRFPWPGERRQRAELADARASVAAQQLVARVAEVSREVELAYVEVAFLSRDLQLLARLLDLLEGLEPIVQARIRAGGSREDLLRLQVAIGVTEDEIASRRAERRASDATLMGAIGLAPRLGDSPVEALRPALLDALDADQLTTHLLEQSPRLAELERQFEVTRQERELAGYLRKPALVLGVETIMTGDALGPGVADSGADPWIVSVAVDLPIWGRSYQAAESRARYAATAARARWDSAARTLAAQVAAQVARAEDAARRVRLYRDTLLPRAEETVRLTLASYRVGEASAFDLIDAERSLLEFERILWRAHRDHHRAQVELRALLGEAL